MSRFVDIDQIIDNIYKKWGCDPTYYVGVSDIDAHEAVLNAHLIEFLNSQPYIEIKVTKDYLLRRTEGNKNGKIDEV